MDEQRRTSIAVLISIFIILLYTQWVSAPHKQPPAKVDNQAVRAEQASILPPQKVESTSLGLPTDFDENTFKSAPRTTVETDSFIAVINHHGARIESLKLKDFRSKLKGPELVDAVYVSEGEPRPLGVVYKNGFSDSSVRYRLRLESLVDEGKTFRVQSPLTLTFEGSAPNGVIVKRFTFNPSGYLFGVEVSPSPAQFEWVRTIPLNDPEQNNYSHKEVVGLRIDGKQERVLSSKIQEGLKQLGELQWLSLSDKYFTVSLVGRSNGVAERSKDTIRTKISGESISVYAGPLEIESLESAGFSLEKNVDLGFFSFLAAPILAVIKSFYKIFGNFGLAIIGFTLLIKALFLPLTKISFNSMKKMQDIAPELQALKERFTDPTELNREMMALYQKKGVNPLGGCFPILVQIPVFFGLYSALLHAIEMRHSKFALWINDLSSPEYLDIFGLPIPVMILLLGISMVYQQKTQPNTIPDPVQRKIFASMPYIFTLMFIIFPMPAGLVLYWLVNNLISIVQQLYLRRGYGAGRATLIASAAIFGLGYLLVGVS